MIRNDLVWYLTEGPYGTEEFFYSYIEEGKYLPQQLKLKIKSVKIYFDTIYALVHEDTVSPGFIENIKMISLCALMGCSHISMEK